VATLKEIAALVGGRVAGDESFDVRGVAGIEEAAEGDITFISNPRYEKRLGSTRAGAIVVREGVKAEGKNLIVVKDPYLAFATILGALRPKSVLAPGISPRAEIRPGASIGKDVSIGPFVFIDEGCLVGDRVVIWPGGFVGANSTIGEDAVIYSNVSIREGTKIGKRVIIHANTVVGSDGFGYAKQGEGHRKIPQVGSVEIEDDVEIGACVTIDRATVGATVIGKGTKIDNLVQIAHNVRIGENSIIVAQVGIAGSTRIGRRATLAGQTGVAGHIEITDDVVIGAKSGVTGDIKEKGVYTGYPAAPHKEWLRATALFLKLPEIKKRLENLEKRLKG
jgi:UDP-3-O-[3-hydroxymyristoyl] glucosamine N-acyltransferase